MIKDIKGYEGLYKISHTGKVKSVISKKWLTPIKHTDGHLRVSLCKNKEKKFYYIHRLVAEAFLENPNNYNVVNHIDGCKTNNHVSNLEYCTQSSNVKHAWNNGLRKRKTTKSELISKLIKLNPELKASVLWRMQKNELKKILRLYQKTGGKNEKTA